MSEITSEEAKELIDYDPETGVFLRKVKTSWRSVVGKDAGSVNGAGYLRIRVKTKQYLAHRLAWLLMTGSFPPEQIDHINGDIRDNRWVNLRSVTRQQNDRNRAVRRDSASGIMGVRRGSRGYGWVARITVDGQRMNLGHFKNLDDAISARKEAEAKYGYHKNSGRPSNAKVS